MVAAAFVVVEMVIMVLITLVVRIIKRVESRAVAAAKLVLCWGNEGEMRVAGSATQGREMVTIVD